MAITNYSERDVLKGFFIKQDAERGPGQYEVPFSTFG